MKGGELTIRHGDHLAGKQSLHGWEMLWPHVEGKEELSAPQIIT